MPRISLGSLFRMRILDPILHSEMDGKGFRKAIEFSYGCSNETLKPFIWIYFIATHTSHEFALFYNTYLLISQSYAEPRLGLDLIEIPIIYIKRSYAILGHFMHAACMRELSFSFVHTLLADFWKTDKPAVMERKHLLETASNLPHIISSPPPLV